MGVASCVERPVVVPKREPVVSARVIGCLAIKMQHDLTQNYSVLKITCTFNLDGLCMGMCIEGIRISLWDILGIN